MNIIEWFRALLAKRVTTCLLCLFLAATLVVGMTLTGCGSSSESSSSSSSKSDDDDDEEEEEEKDPMEEAFENTYDALENRFEDAPYQFLIQLVEAMDAGTIGATIDDGYTYGDMAVTFNQKSGLYGATVQLSGDDQALQGQGFISADEVAVKVDGMENAYGIRFDSFADDLDNSFLAGEFTEEDREMLVITVGFFQYLLESDFDAWAQPYVDVVLDYAETIEFEEDTNEIELDGEDVECDTYTMTADKDQMKELLTAYLNAMEEDGMLKMAYAMYMVSEGRVTALSAVADMDVYYQEFIQYMWQGVDTFDQQYESLDQEITYYVSDKYLVAIEIGLDAEALDYEGNLQSDSATSYILFGQDPEKDDLIMGVEYEGEVVEAVYSSQMDGDVFTDQLAFRGDEEIPFYWTSSWDQASGDWVTELEVEGDYLSLTFNLVMEKDSFTLALDEMITDGTACTIYVNDNDDVETFSYLNMDEWDEEALQEDYMNAFYP